MSERILSTCLVFFFSGMIYMSLLLPFGSWRMPLLVSSFGLALSIIYLGRSFLVKPREDSVTEDLPNRGEEDRYRGRRVRFVFAICAFLGATYVLGLTAAVPFFLFISGVLVFRESLKSTLLMTLVGWGIYYVLFIQLLELSTYKGIVQGFIK